MNYLPYEYTLRWTFSQASISLIKYGDQKVDPYSPYSSIGRTIDLYEIDTFSDVKFVKHFLIRPKRWFALFTTKVSLPLYGLTLPQMKV